MQKIGIKIKKLNKNATIPTYGTANAAGADLYACTEGDLKIEAGETKFVSTGIALEIPEGLVGLVYARSSLGCKQGLAPANKVGVIDSDYRGEIIVALHNHSKEAKIIENGQRIAQIVFAPYIMGDFEEVETLEESVRGEGGFGSTGKK